MKKEVHGSDSQKHPIVSTVFENVEEWHGIVGESMNKKSFQFTFAVMAQNHC